LGFGGGRGCGCLLHGMEHILMLGGDRERFQVQMAGLVPNEDDWIPGFIMKWPANLTRAKRTGNWRGRGTHRR